MNYSSYSEHSIEELAPSKAAYLQNVEDEHCFMLIPCHILSKFPPIHMSFGYYVSAFSYVGPFAETFLSI